VTAELPQRGPDLDICRLSQAAEESVSGRVTSTANVVVGALHAVSNAIFRSFMLVFLALGGFILPRRALAARPSCRRRSG